jgi:dihydrofolate synthase/folylpolyglutamate synthase
VTSDPIAYLFALDQFGIKFGLDNIRSILRALDHPERAFRSVHIAGTNGKGSVAAMVNTALRAAGHRTALYTSPHLLDLEERFVIDGCPVDRDRLRASIADVRTVVDQLSADGTLRAQPTFFEVTTAVAFELFRRAAVEIAVCEVGLGGRLDATNVLEPVVTAITSIGLDHQRYLGHTLREIAIEKAGIIKPGTPVVVGPMDREPLAEIEHVAKARGAPLIHASEHAVGPTFRSGADVTFRSGVAPSSLKGARIQLRTPVHDYGEVTLGLPGDHQIANALVAVGLLEVLDGGGLAVPASAIVAGVRDVAWPGRLELRTLADGRQILMDAAHNPDGARALAAFLLTHEWRRPPLVFAAMRDKDVPAMLTALSPAVGALILTRASNSRAADPNDLVEHARRIAPALPCSVAPRVADALAAAWRISPHIVAAGSIFLLGDVIKEITEA